MNNFSEKVSFIWGVADLLRGDYKQSEINWRARPNFVVDFPPPAGSASFLGPTRRQKSIRSLGLASRPGPETRGTLRVWRVWATLRGIFLSALNTTKATIRA